MPGTIRTFDAEGEASVIAQGVGRAGRAVLLEVAIAREEAKVRSEQLARNECRILQLAGAEREIDALRHKIDFSGCGKYCELNKRIVGLKCDDELAEHAAEIAWCRNPEEASGFVL